MVSVRISEIERELYGLRALQRAIVDRDVLDDALARAASVMTPEQMAQAGFGVPEPPADQGAAEPPPVEPESPTPISARKNGQESIPVAGGAKGGGG
jgi:hypothetical protein